MYLLPAPTRSANHKRAKVCRHGRHAVPTMPPYLRVARARGRLQCAVDKEAQPGGCDGAPGRVREHDVVPALRLEAERQLRLVQLGRQAAHHQPVACGMHGAAGGHYTVECIHTWYRAQSNAIDKCRLGWQNGLGVAELL